MTRVDICVISNFCVQGEGDAARAVLTGEVEDVPCGLIISSIGYKSIPIDPTVPFDSHKAIVPNKNGRVQQATGRVFTVSHKNELKTFKRKK